MTDGARRAAKRAGQLAGRTEDEGTGRAPAPRGDRVPPLRPAIAVGAGREALT
jgi:hypothetical protein